MVAAGGLAHARGTLGLSRCVVVGIVNRTPDSFYDGGRMGLSESTDHALKLVDEGAGIIDVGAVKAGPGPDVGEAEEAARLLPLVERLAARVDVPIAVETARPGIAARAVDAGAAIVNDVTGLADPEVAAVCARTGAALVLMHNGGQLRGRPRHPRYDDVVAEVADAWDAMTSVARALGVPPGRIVLDPGLDFGKTTYHSLELVARLGELTGRPEPVLVAPSRKDVVGEVLGAAPGDRLEGTLALVALSVEHGAAAVRVHDVAAAVDVVRMVEAVARRRAPAVPIRGLWD